MSGGRERTPKTNSGLLFSGSLRNLSLFSIAAKKLGPGSFSLGKILFVKKTSPESRKNCERPDSYKREKKRRKQERRWRREGERQEHAEAKPPRRQSRRGGMLLSFNFLTCRHSPSPAACFALFFFLSPAQTRRDFRIQENQKEEEEARASKTRRRRKRETHLLKKEKGEVSESSLLGCGRRGF